MRTRRRREPSPGPQRGSALLTPWFLPTALASDLQNRRRVNVCGFKAPISWSFVRQPQETDAGIVWRPSSYVGWVRSCHEWPVWLPRYFWLTELHVQHILSTCYVPGTFSQCQMYKNKARCAQSTASRKRPRSVRGVGCLGSETTRPELQSEL